MFKVIKIILNFKFLIIFIVVINLFNCNGAENFKNLNDQLMYAIQGSEGDISLVVKLLKDPSVNVNYKEPFDPSQDLDFLQGRPPALGRTPIIAAVQAKNDKIVELLINNKADINMRDKRGITALSWAVCFLRNDKVVKILLDHNFNASLLSDAEKKKLFA